MEPEFQSDQETEKNWKGKSQLKLTNEPKCWKTIQKKILAVFASINPVMITLIESIMWGCSLPLFTMIIYSSLGEKILHKPKTFQVKGNAKLNTMLYYIKIVLKFLKNWKTFSKRIKDSLSSEPHCRQGIQTQSWRNQSDYLTDVGIGFIGRKSIFKKLLQN